MHRKIWALFASLTLGLVGAVALAGSASASELPHVETNVEDCETASLTLVNPRGYGVTFAYRKGSGDWTEVPVAAGAEEDVPLGYDERSGRHTVAYKVTKSPESDDRRGLGSVEVDCLTDVTPTAPTAVDATCDDDQGAIRITRTEGVRYKLDGKHVGKGTNPVAPGEYEVTAHARKGYELADGAASAWTLTVNPATDCPSDDPSTDPSTEPTTDPNTDPSADPSVTPSDDVTTDPVGDLPKTGYPGWFRWVMAGGLGLIASGAGLLLLARRRGWIYS